MRFLIIALLLHEILFAQVGIKWIEQTNSFSLPTGARLFYGKREVGSALNCWYLDVDMNNPKIMVRPYIIEDGVKKDPATFNKLTGAYASINGGFFGGSESYSAVVYPNTIKAKNITSVVRGSNTYPIVRAFFGIKTDKKLSCDWIYHFGPDLDDIYRFMNPLSNPSDPNGTPALPPSQVMGNKYDSLLVGIGGGPMLIKNGQIKITYNEEVFWGSGVGWTNNDPRSAVGYTINDHIILFIADGRQANSAGVSLDELASIMKSLGCFEAINLDGGGSTQLAIGTNMINSASDGNARPVVSIFAVVNSDSVKIPLKVEYEKIIDTEYPDVLRSGSSWFETANTGYYGSTKSLLCPIGNGSEYVEYRLKLPAEGNYELQGWWVAASNRSKSTPYIIKHSNINDTIFVDQTSNGSVWYKLGSFHFNGDTLESITVTNKGTGGSYVVADAIRIVSYKKVTYLNVGANNSNSSTFTLFQNYPNPFNPSTKIEFFIPVKEMTTLKIFDINGKEIETLINHEITPGNYTVQWNPKNLPSGIYIYSLSSGKYSIKRKMIYLR